MIRRSRVQLPAAALSGNDLGQVVHTNVPLFTKQYKALSTLSQKSETVAENGDCRRNKSHFSATVWTGLKLVLCDGFHVDASFVAAMA